MTRKFDIEEVKDFIRNSSGTTSIYIGADSERYRGRDDQWYADYALVIVVHKNGNNGGKIFGEKRNWWNPMETMKFLKATYNHQALADSLHNAFGDITIGSNKIKTGLCIVCKRADTNSTWPIINHPNGKFFKSFGGENSKIPLW